MKKSEGFTLVELLATFTILAIISTIAAVSVNNILNRSNDESTNIQQELIEGAAKQYASDPDHINACSTSCEVDINTLVIDGYLDDSENLDFNKILIITKKNKKYHVEYK